jgi:GMP reductase
MDTSGTFGVASVLSKHKCIVALNKFEKPAGFAAFLEANPGAGDYIAVSAGTSDADFENVAAVLKACPAISFICLDVANGYSEYFVDAVKRYRAAFPDKTLIAGNVVTGEMTEELILSGADIVKVGIGPGSVCTTRRQTGVGYPQLSAIMECSDAAHGLGGMIIGDGGITCPGDVAKAMGAGGDFVMIGGMFAGHDESGGELVVKPDGKKYKLFYGMSSSTAMVKHVGKVAEYRSSEGRTVELPYRGPLEPTVLDLLGGLRSACTCEYESTDI